ncbi:MAG: putative aminohydrolase SsnA [Anaerolineales bacterium]|uniref:putative aminohydrolase SsnA n=1 Tax=Candidatus Villigracilis proximus TaxID=3140683 RepID=UPI00313643E5|nr:putative aminohydrolase SsnA [Anaerolineales bacterium]MBK9208355.1 putative aminohydrolase SsnA [Anaerolineales bacterium]
MLITNANIITWESKNRILQNYAIYIESDRIKEIGTTKALTAKYPKAKTLDARGQYVMPGNICAHTHFYGAFARGLAIPGPAPKDFPEILQKLWWPLDRSLDAEGIRLSALVCLVDAIKHGTTTLIDHHASPNYIDGSLDLIADAVDKSGLRGVLCYEVTDRDGTEKANSGINENVRFLKRLAANPHPRLAGTFGLHASLTLSGITLQACRAAVPEGTGFHVHTAEHESDEYDSLAKSEMRVVDRLLKHNILGPNTIAAHGVHFDAREMEILKETGTWLTHQPRSNMNNGVGVAQIESMMRMGIKVCLGNDGFSNAMWEEWKTAYLLHKSEHRDPRRMGGYDVTQMAVYNNAALANQFFPAAPIGQITEGAFADLIFVDYSPYTPMTDGNLPWHIIFGFQQSMVTTTIAAGKVLMKDRELLTLDEKEIAARALEVAPRIWKKYEEEVAKS